MKYIKVKDIKVEPDIRKSNILKRDSTGKPIKFKQSKCTCQIHLEDNNGEEYIWVARNESLAKAIKLIAENEDKKYPLGLGRNLFFLSWLYEIYIKYLVGFGFRPPTEDLIKAERFKHGNQD